MEYLPKTNEQLLTWLKNFSDQLKSLGSTLGITPAETAALNALILDVKEDIRAGRSGSDLDAKKEKMSKFLNDLVNKMKAHPKYKADEHGKKMNLN